MSPRTAGFSNRDCFELTGKIGLHRTAGCNAGHRVGAVRLCSVRMCWAAASAVNSFIPRESATLSLNLPFSVSSCACITPHLGPQEYALSRKVIV